MLNFDIPSSFHVGETKTPTTREIFLSGDVIIVILKYGSIRTNHHLAIGAVIKYREEIPVSGAL
nr:MAG TPA_asm: hypothetical protein [Caudoviricetes sp.]